MMIARDLWQRFETLHAVTYLREALAVPAREVAASGTLRYPNPIGLPRLT